MSLSAVCTHSFRLNIYQYTSLCHEPAMLFTPHPHPHPMHGKQNEAPCPLREIKPLCYDAAVAPTMSTCLPPENKEEKEKKKHNPIAMHADAPNAQSSDMPYAKKRKKRKCSYYTYTMQILFKTFLFSSLSISKVSPSIVTPS